jgi:hypothetical protein
MPTVETVLNVADAAVPQRKKQFEAADAQVQVVANVEGASAIKATYNDGSIETILNVTGANLPQRKKQFEAARANVEVIANQPNASAVVATYP